MVLGIERMTEPPERRRVAIQLISRLACFTGIKHTPIRSDRQAHFWFHLLPCFELRRKTQRHASAIRNKKNPGPCGPGSPPLAYPGKAATRAASNGVCAGYANAGVRKSATAGVPPSPCHPWPDPFGSSGWSYGV
jgi:hypothetical protein